MKLKNINWVKDPIKDIIVENKKIKGACIWKFKCVCHGGGSTYRCSNFSI